MMTGRARIDAAFRIAWSGVSPSSDAEVLREVNHEHRVGDDDADHEDHAQKRLDIDRRVR